VGGALHKHRNVGLTIINEHFTDITVDQISDFGVKLDILAEKFALNGPARLATILTRPRLTLVIFLKIRIRAIPTQTIEKIKK